jgi:hypothetical protein
MLKEGDQIEDPVVDVKVLKRMLQETGRKIFTVVMLLKMVGHSCFVTTAIDTRVR